MKNLAAILLLTISFSTTQLMADNGKGNEGNGIGNGGNFGDAPEIDPASAASAVALLGGAVLVIRGRKK